MKLYRCDRCHQLFTPGYSGSSKVTFDISQSQIPPLHSKKEYDLCPKCTDSVLNSFETATKTFEELIYGENSVL